MRESQDRCVWSGLGSSKTVLLAVISSVLSCQAASTSAGISGVVSDSSGQPIPGAVVTYRRLPAYIRTPNGRPMLKPGEVSAFSSATSDANGRHSAQGIPDGDYVVCASVPGQPVLDPCLWQTPPTVKLQGGSAPAENLTLSKGVFLKVHVNDPTQALPSNSATSDNPLISLGAMFGSGGYLPAPQVSTDASGKDYAIAIPVNQPLALSISSLSISIADPAGNLIPSTGLRIPFTALQGVDQSYTLTALGRLSVAGAQH